MAKTLIGNIKGQDGRGISKIEKTATTGVVDTYTITYTDGTSTTYELKNSDEIAIQRQIVPSAAVESSTTASQAYTAGDYVVVGGVLRKMTSSIAKGSTIGDSNSTATTATEEIATVRDFAYRTLYMLDASKLRIQCDDNKGYLILGIITPSGTEYRLACEKDSIHFDRYDPSGNGTVLWEK